MSSLGNVGHNRHAKCLIGLQRLTHQDRVTHYATVELSHLDPIGIQPSCELIAAFYQVQIKIRSNQNAPMRLLVNRGPGSEIATDLVSLV